MKRALKALDQKVPESFHLLIGGGAAFLLGHQIPLSTMDIDGIPFKTKLKPADLDVYVKEVAGDLGIPHDWLNSYFGTFTYSLPKDYGDRLIPVFTGKKITALALGKEDLLIMKCFAHRAKDVSHAAALIKKGVDLGKVAAHLHRCREEGIPKGADALDFFYEMCERLGVEV